jgi:hypothetical protein
MDETQTQKMGNGTKITIGIMVLLLIIGVYMIFRSTGNGLNNGTATTTTQATTTNGVVQGNGYTIEQVPVETTTNSGTPKPVPDLNREIFTYPGANISAEARAAAVVKVKEFQTALKNNPADFSSWISLGIYQKMAGDYDGAIISWTYASKLAPSDYISLGNIGNLYAYFIHDNGQAEVYYKQAIKRGPTTVYLYQQLAEVYRDVFKDLDKARAIVNEGLAKIPNDPLLLQLKANLK